MSVDAHFFRRELCKFLEVKANHFSITYPNHNAKILRYHIIEGSCLPVTGIDVIGAQMLQVAGIYRDLWRPKDFAFDLLILKLASSETVKNLTDIIMIGEDPEAVGSLCASPYFLRLGLYAVNTKVIHATMRVSFMWCYMMWITSIKNICIISKRNIVTSKIFMLFLASRSYMSHPINATYEPSEHTYGHMRQYKQEMTVL